MKTAFPLGSAIIGAISSLEFNHWCAGVGALCAGVLCIARAVVVLRTPTAAPSPSDQPETK
jgi:hypothetical protein